MMKLLETPTTELRDEHITKDEENHVQSASNIVFSAYLPKKKGGIKGDGRFLRTPV